MSRFSSNTCTLSNNLTLNSAYNLNLNASGSGQVIFINGTGVTLDCNGTTIFGNRTANGKGIYTNKGNNTIKNCNVYGYNQNIRTDTGADGLSIIANIIGDSLAGSIVFFTNTISYAYLNVSNNKFLDSNATTLVTGTNITNSFFFGNNFTTNNISKGALSFTTFNINLTIANNRIVGFNPGLRVDSTFNSSIRNNKFYNISTLNGIRASVRVEGLNFTANEFYNVGYPFSFNNVNNTEVVNNVIVNGTLVTCQNNCNGLRIIGNNVTNVTNNEYNSQFINNTNLLYSRNTIRNQGIKGILIQQKAHNLNFTLNNFINASQTTTDSSPFIYFLRTTSAINNLVEYNYFHGASNLIASANNSNLTIQHNAFDTAKGNGDSYNNGMLLINGNNLYIFNNTLSNIGCTGLLSTNNNNISIINNSFSAGGLAYNINNNLNCAYEPLSAIALSELWKTWEQDGSEQATDNRTNKIGFYNTRNVIITGNIFSGFPVILKAQRPVNLTHDLINYWYRQYQTPQYLIDPTELYLSNDWNNATTTFNETNGNPVIARTILGEGFMGSTSSIKMQFEIFRDYYWFKNVNVTENYSTGVFNITNALIYFDNNSVVCTNIINCDDNINFTLTPNNYSYVLDNFNLTEGVTRQFSPLSISGTSTSKTITSQLSQAITATVVVNVPKCNFNQITYDGNPISPESCANGQAIFLLNNIPSGSSLLIISYSGGTPSINECDATESLFTGIASLGTIGNIAPVLVAVTAIVYLIFGFKVFRRSGNPKLIKVEGLWHGFIGLLMFAMLGVAIALVTVSNIPC